MGTRNMRNIVHKALFSIIMTVMMAGTAYAQKTPSNGSDNRKYFIDGVTLYSLGAYNTALTSLQKYLATHPDDDAAMYYIGLAYIYSDSKKVAQGINYIKRAHELVPDNYDYASMYANLLSMQSGSEKEAIAILESLTEKYPKKNEAYLSLYPLYARSGELQKALDTVLRIEEIYGENPSTIRIKFNLLKDLDKAAEGYEMLKEYYADSLEGDILADEWIFFSDVYVSAGMDSMALQCLEKARKVDPLDKALPFKIAQAYYEMGDFETYFKEINACFQDKSMPLEVNVNCYKTLLSKARPEFVEMHKEEYNTLTQSLTVANPSDSTVLSTAAMYYYSTSQYDLAASAIKVNMIVHPTSPQIALDYLSMIYSMRKWDDDFEKVAMDSYRKFGYYEFLDILGAAYAQRGMNDEAIEAYAMAAKAFGNNEAVQVQCYSNIGQLYYRIYDKTGSEKKYKKCLEYYEKVLRIDQDNLLALNNYAYFLSLRGKKLSKALEMSLKTVRMEPENPTYLDTAAYILCRMGRYEDAKTYFKKAMACGGKTHKEILLHYAECLNALGDKTLAEYYTSLASQLKDE